MWRGDSVTNMTERTKWYERSPGNASAMRIIAMLCALTGCIAVVAAVFGMFFGAEQASAIATVGGGMAGLGEVSKAWQSGKE